MANTRKKAGLTLIELIVCTVIIGILSATALPLSRNFIRREKEDALKDRLRTLREGLDRYREKIHVEKPQWDENKCFPKKFEDLVEKRILRRIPVDPMTDRIAWGTRSTSDSPGAHLTDGRNIFDVYSLASGTAADGTSYASW